MAAPELRHAERQVAVGADALIEDLHVPGTVHRLKRKDALVGAGVFVGCITGVNMFPRNLSQWPDSPRQLAVNQLRV